MDRTHLREWEPPKSLFFDDFGAQGKWLQANTENQKAYSDAYRNKLRSLTSTGGLYSTDARKAFEGLGETASSNWSNALAGVGTYMEEKESADARHRADLEFQRQTQEEQNKWQGGQNTQSQNWQGQQNANANTLSKYGIDQNIAQQVASRDIQNQQFNTSITSQERLARMTTELQKYGIDATTAQNAANRMMQDEQFNKNLSLQNRQVDIQNQQFGRNLTWQELQAQRADDLSRYGIDTQTGLQNRQMNLQNQQFNSSLQAQQQQTTLANELAKYQIDAQTAQTVASRVLQSTQFNMTMSAQDKQQALSAALQREGMDATKAQQAANNLMQTTQFNQTIGLENAKLAMQERLTREGRTAEEAARLAQQQYDRAMVVMQNQNAQQNMVLNNYGPQFMRGLSDGGTGNQGNQQSGGNWGQAYTGAIGGIPFNPSGGAGALTDFQRAQTNLGNAQNWYNTYFQQNQPTPTTPEQQQYEAMQKQFMDLIQRITSRQGGQFNYA